MEKYLGYPKATISSENSGSDVERGSVFKFSDGHCCCIEGLGSKPALPLSVLVQLEMERGRSPALSFLSSRSAEIFGVWR